MADPSPHQDEDGPVRIARGRFLGAGLAAAGAALIPSANAAAARSRPALRAAATPLPQLPLRAAFPNLPAIPIDAANIAETLARLLLRAQQAVQAKQGLTHEFTLGGQTQTAYQFLFGTPETDAHTESIRELAAAMRNYPRRARRRRVDAAPAATPLTLENPEQFSIGWTYFPNVYASGRPHLTTWASSLTDVDAATSQFWPMIAEHGFGYNLIIPERVTSSTAGALRQAFGSAWTAAVRAALARGDLYVIDMTRFAALPAQTVSGASRFTPATMTLLIRNRQTKSLTPVAIIVSGQNGAGRQVYRKGRATNGAWLYALQAAKASVSVFGVWLGHVYHWHIVTAAMIMTMLNTLPATHPIYLLLAPQSKYVMAFDDVLIEGWSAIAPPTSLASANDFYALANGYAAGRSYFDDDPTTTIQQLGLRRRDFTAKTAWDKYPVVQRLLTLWNLVSKYVDAFVAATYPSDGSVAADANLQAWIAAASSADATTGGNIRGLPAMDSRAAVASTLRSLLYRITAHGISRMNSTSNPALTFVPNYPHCLQRTDIPGPRTRVSTKSLLGYLPNTDTISQSLTFYYIFAYSTPYEPFIPLGGTASELFFPGGSGDARNRALIDLRQGLAAFIKSYQPEMPQRFQWPRNIET